MAKTLEEIEKEFQLHMQTKDNPETEAESAEPEMQEQIEETRIEKPSEATVLTEVEAAERTSNQETQEKKSVATKASLASDIIFYVALVAMVLCAVLFSKNGLGNNSLAGYQYFEVLTTSMQSVYPRGSLVLVKAVNSDRLEVGDDITFYRNSSTSVTHRIIEIQENYDGNGSKGFITKGVENADPDSGVVDEKNIVGKVIYSIPKVGATISWLGENLWVLIAVFGSLVAFSFFLKIFFRETKKALRNE
ncbi:MAG: signal peptidase I [Hespellia sp.]|nr:signal peptidase I [Hespellia sp.]